MLVLAETQSGKAKGRLTPTKVPRAGSGRERRNILAAGPRGTLEAVLAGTGVRFPPYPPRNQVVALPYPLAAGITTPSGR